MQKLDIRKVRPLIRMAMEEDLGRGDVTTNLLFQDGTRASANMVSREEIVVAGLPVVKEILRQYDPRLKLTAYFEDGQPAHVGNKLATIRGPLRSMLCA
jgi:nicotinate-nucleotide pyrophosphorylase (carboxylating)